MIVERSICQAYYEEDTIKYGLVLYAWWWILVSFLHTFLYLSSLLARGLPSTVSILLIRSLHRILRLFDLLLLPHACISIRHNNDPNEDTPLSI
jgi:hypothetical protein